jgi:chromosome transmission fidelity protein 4
MLHHLNSYDTAQKVAQFYHLVGLQEKMGMLKRQREKVLGGEGEEERDVRKGWGKVSEPVRRSYDLNEERKRGSTMFQDFLPPPAITRRSLAAAVPVLPSTNAASRLPPIHDPSTFLYTDDSMTSEPDSFSFSAFSDIASKRKRDDDEVTSDVDVDKQEGPSVSKKRPNAENGDSAKHSMSNWTFLL